MDHPLSEKLASYLDSLQHERGLQASTIKLYSIELNVLLKLLPRADSSLLRYNLRKLSPVTQWRKLVIWRSFLLTCQSPWRELLADFRTPKIRQKEPSFLTEDEAFRLESVCYKTKHISRNRLLIALALQLGLRLSEILRLKFSDIEEGWLKIYRKGGREQRLPLTPGLQALINFWKAEAIAQNDSWIFSGRSSEPMSPRSAQLLLKELATKAGIQKKISPHTLRHTFATTLASRGANLAALKEILGHQRITTTERYLHVTPTHLRETLGLLSQNALKTPSLKEATSGEKLSRSNLSLQST
jgi:site-specific recombinase XerD